jgi:hypothetical protein
MAVLTWFDGTFLDWAAAVQKTESQQRDNDFGEQLIWITQNTVRDDTSTHVISHVRKIRIVVMWLEPRGVVPTHHGK